MLFHTKPLCTCIVTLLHIMYTCRFMLSYVVQCDLMLYICFQVLQYSAHRLVYDVIVCTCIVTLLHMMQTSLFMFFHIVQCCHVLYICSSMLRCNLYMFGNVVTCSDSVTECKAMLTEVFTSRRSVMHCYKVLPNVNRHTNTVALMINYNATCYLMLSMCCQMLHYNVHMLFYVLLRCTTLSCNIHVFYYVIMQWTYVLPCWKTF